jgi:phosphatidylglycerol:prolipoprotein diacylglycerol transferase
MNWWQHLPENIDPTIFSLGSFQLRWYGTMYLVAFAVVYFLVMYRYRTEGIRIKKEVTQNWFGVAVLGVLIGGRIGYVLFYDPAMILENPLGIFLPFDLSNGVRFTGLAGMSFHGGLIAVFLLTLWYCKKNNVNFWEMADLLVPAIPLGYTFGRIGNFINGELYGRLTEVAWGMYFPNDPSGQLRHPSQLYEAFGEGVLLFIVLWSLRKKQRLAHLFLPLYLMGYGVVRFFIEFVRQPDAHLGTVLGPFSMGQVLCFAMIIGGAILIPIARRSVKRS